MKYVMCNIYIKDYNSKYLVYNDSNFIVFNVISYKIYFSVGERHFSVLRDVTINISCL